MAEVDAESVGHTHWEDACHLSVKQAGHAGKHDHAHEGGDSEQRQLVLRGKLFLGLC